MGASKKNSWKYDRKSASKIVCTIIIYFLFDSPYIQLLVRKVHSRVGCLLLCIVTIMNFNDVKSRYFSEFDSFKEAFPVSCVCRSSAAFPHIIFWQIIHASLRLLDTRRIWWLNVGPPDHLRPNSPSPLNYRPIFQNHIDVANLQKHLTRFTELCPNCSGLLDAAMATACAATLDPVALVEAMSAKLVSNRQITDDAIENAKELCRWTLETLSPQRNSLWEGVWEIAVVAFAKASRVRSSGCTLESLNDMTLETIVPGSCQNLDVSVHQFDDRSKQVKAKELKLVHELLTCLLLQESSEEDDRLLSFCVQRLQFDVETLHLDLCGIHLLFEGTGCQWE